MFMEELDALLDTSDGIRVISTSKVRIGLKSHNREMQFFLKGLEPKDSILCLLTKAPRNISNEEIAELLKSRINSTVNSKNESGYLNPLENVANKTLDTHPFFVFLAGNPAEISMYASQLETNSLEGLYRSWCTPNMYGEGDTFVSDSSHDISERISFEMTLQKIKKSGSRAIELLQLLSLFPSGIREGDVHTLWGNESWIPYKEELITVKFLSYRTSKRGELLFFLTKYVIFRAIETLEKDPKKNEIYNKTCIFLKNMLEKMHWQKKSNPVKRKFFSLEGNILACIERYVDQISNEKVTESSVEDVLEPTLNKTVSLGTKLGRIIPNKMHWPNKEKYSDSDDSDGFPEEIKQEMTEEPDTLNDYELLILYYIVNLIHIYDKTEEEVMFNFCKEKLKMTNLFLANIYKYSSYTYSYHKK